MTIKCAGRKVLWLSVVGVLCTCMGVAGVAGEEDDLIGVLQSERSPQEKDNACVRLRVIGTAKSVPVLAGLLNDKELGFSARYALAAIPGPESLAALRAALPKTEGLVKAGLIDSLGQRRDAGAVGDLAGLLGDADAVVAASAARALGRIGGGDAASALRAAMPRTKDAVKTAVLDGLLACAEDLLDAGKEKDAHALYETLCEAVRDGHVRTAACRGLILSAGPGTSATIERALAGDCDADRMAVLPLVQTLPGVEATRAFAAVLEKAPPATRVALLEALAQRGDVAARPAIVKRTGDSDPDVRRAALRAIGALGDGSVVGLLAKAASEGDADSRKTAMDALIQLQGADVTPAILSALGEVAEPVQSVLCQVLRYRRDPAAVAGLAKWAESGKDSVRVESLKALTAIADGAFLPEAVRLLVGAKNEEERSHAVTLASACAKQVKDPETRAGPVLQAFDGAKGNEKAALLAVLPSVGGEKALTAARSGLKSEDGVLRLAAVRALSEWPDAGCADDLMAVAREPKSETEGVLALRGYLRLLALPGSGSVVETVQRFASAMDVARRVEEKRLVLSGLSQVGAVEAVDVAAKYLNHPELKSEAAAAIVSMAEQLQTRSGEEARRAIEKALASDPPAQVKAQATQILNAIEKTEDYILAWSVAGPYQADGQGPQQLFDVAFDPEKPDAKIAWRALTGAASAENPVIIDLQKALATENCVAYLKTTVESGSAQEALLEVGSDDGVKIWLNGQLVHAVNVLRPCQPGQEKVKVSLKEGANLLMLKITQGGMGWGACARLRAANGGKLAGITLRR